MLYSPRKKPLNKPVVKMNDYHCAAGYSHESLLRKTAEQQGVVLEVKMMECKGCSMVKGLRGGIKQSTHTREDKELGRVFVDLSGPEVVQSHRRKRYTLIVRDDFSRNTWVYFTRYKIGRHGNAQTSPHGYSCRWCPIAGGDGPIRWGR